MFFIEDILVSDEILEKKFCCDISACMGACCVEGDYGAPLLPEEVEIVRELAGKVKPVLDDAGRKALEEGGAVTLYPGMDSYGTALRPDGACVFTVFDEYGRAGCGIEKQYEAGEVSFKKPLSCHLYPVRVTRNPELGFTAMNYDEWEICKPALLMGQKNGLPLFRFLKEALIRGFGEEFYEALEAAYEYRRQEKEKEENEG